MTTEEKIITVWNNVDGEIKDIVAGLIKTRRAYYEKLAHKLHEQMKEDAKRYTMLLADGSISQSDYEVLMVSRYAQLKVELMSELSISKSKFEEIAMKVLNIAMTGLLAAI